MKITSSNEYLNNLTAWAEEKAKQFIMTGKTGPVNVGDGNKYYGPSGRFSKKAKKTRKQNKPWTKERQYIPSYWAGYYDRTAFYIRDFVHQAKGAEILGYHEENYSMMKSFVSLASEETGRYAPWALNFDGSVYYLDTPNYKRFVREILSQYEMVETICNLYLMTGDERYLRKEFTDYCENILGVFTVSRDSDKNGVPEGVGNIWEGSSSYNESGISFRESGDCIAALYKALESYAQLSGKKEYEDRAKALKNYFNNEWSTAPDGGYVFGIDKNGKKHYRWTKSVRGIIGAETCFIMPIKQLTEPGERNDRLLREIDERAKDPKTAMPNIESYTYLPDVFFPYYKAENAWYWMKYIGDRKDVRHVKASQGNNGDYPEISFTLISSAVCGLLGFSSDLPNGIVSTFPCLPDCIEDIAVSDLNIGGCTFDISVSDRRTFKNRSEREILWKCVYEGDMNALFVDGKETACAHETVNGVKRSYVTVKVLPNASAEVRR